MLPTNLVLGVVQIKHTSMWMKGLTVVISKPRFWPTLVSIWNSLSLVLLMCAHMRNWICISTLFPSWLQRWLWYRSNQGIGAKQPVHWYLGGRVVVIQQGTNVWVGLPYPQLGHYDHNVNEAFDVIQRAIISFPVHHDLVLNILFEPRKKHFHLVTNGYT